MARIAFGGATVAIISLLLPGYASAFTIFDGFGSFPDANWGGSGIPNDAVAASNQFVYDYGTEASIRCGSR